MLKTTKSTFLPNGRANWLEIHRCVIKKINLKAIFQRRKADMRREGIGRGRRR